ncbi:MAG TPA: winged helix-turn-helix transcriptional regulator, partial [Puia sp.]
MSLETEGFVSNKKDPGHKQKFLYSLTAKSIDLFPVIFELDAWSMKYQPVDKERFAQAGQLSKAGQPAKRKIRRDLARKHLKENSFV